MGKKIMFWGVIVLLVSSYSASGINPHQIYNTKRGIKERKDTLVLKEKQKIIAALQVLSSAIVNPFYTDTLLLAQNKGQNIRNKLISKTAVLGKDTFPTSSYPVSELPEDTLKNDIEIIENNLDSIESLYNTKMTSAAVAVEISKFNDIPDSVFIKRLSRMPMIMHLPYNEKVRDFIRLYTAKKKNKLGIMIGMSDYYFPIFEKVLDEKNMPIELKYLAIIESALNPIARSRAGAVGLWQFMIGTGKMYKLEVNSFVDERRDPIRATNAAAKYLNDLYAIYGDWTLVIAAYNCGPGNVNKAIRRAGGKKDYWSVYNYLPKETRGYVPCFIAAAYAFNYYKEHNVTITKFNNSFETDTIMLNKKLHLGQVADVLNIPIELLRLLNPQYKKDIIPAHDEKSYSLCLPSEVSLRFIDLKDSIYKHRGRTYYDERQVVELPSKNGKPISSDMSKLTYTVKQGDNLGLIASLYDVTSNDLRIWNKVGRKLTVGKQISVFVPNANVERYRHISSSVIAAVEDNKPTIAKSPSFASTQTIKTINQAKTPEYTTNSQIIAASNGFVYYVIQSGDNLWTIAKKYPGVTNLDIMKLNNLNERSVKNLRPGQTIKVLKK